SAYSPAGPSARNWVVPDKRTATGWAAPSENRRWTAQAAKRMRPVREREPCRAVWRASGFPTPAEHLERCRSADQVVESGRRANKRRRAAAGRPCHACCNNSAGSLRRRRLRLWTARTNVSEVSRPGPPRIGNVPRFYGMTPDRTQGKE